MSKYYPFDPFAQSIRVGSSTGRHKNLPALTTLHVPSTIASTCFPSPSSPTARRSPRRKLYGDRHREPVTSSCGLQRACMSWVVTRLDCPLTYAVRPRFTHRIPPGRTSTTSCQQMRVSGCRTPGTGEVDNHRSPSTNLPLHSGSLPQTVRSGGWPTLRVPSNGGPTGAPNSSRCWRRVSLDGSRSRCLRRTRRKPVRPVGAQDPEYSDRLPR